MIIQPPKAGRRDLERRMAKLPATMSPVPKDQWPPGQFRQVPTRVWVSRDFVAQLYNLEGEGARLTVCRTQLKDDGRWGDGITWDQLQEVKAQCGFGDFWAVEVYPAAAAVVDVANMRHLWLVSPLDLPPGIGWRRPEVASLAGAG